MVKNATKAGASKRPAVKTATKKKAHPSTVTTIGAPKRIGGLKRVGGAKGTTTAKPKSKPVSLPVLNKTQMVDIFRKTLEKGCTLRDVLFFVRDMEKEYVAKKAIAQNDKEAGEPRTRYVEA